MAILKQASVKFPLLLAVPVLLVIGVVAVIMLQPEPPPQPKPPEPLPLNDGPGPSADGGDPLIDPDPRPRPQPKPGAPTEITVAQAMEAEVDRAFEEVRARLELKFKGAEYVLDRTWTLEQVVRRTDKLIGTHFDATDYTLTFPQSDDALAEITCATVKGLALPDGPLVMRVNVRTGETSRTGRILARNAAGYVLIGETEYRLITDVLRGAVSEHLMRQRHVESGLAEFTPVELRSESAMAVEDFTATPSKTGLGVVFACRTIQKAELAEPAVIVVDYGLRSVKISEVDNVGWMQFDLDREQFTRRSDWLLRNVTTYVTQQAANGAAIENIRVELADNNEWRWHYSSLTPFDIKIAECSPERVVLEISTHYGRPLPFAKVRYVAEPAAGTYKFE